MIGCCGGDVDVSEIILFISLWRSLNYAGNIRLLNSVFASENIEEADIKFSWYNGSTNVNCIVDTGDKPAVDTWYHWTVKYNTDVGNVTIYKNGVNVKSCELDQIVYSSNPFEIGIFAPFQIA